MDETKKPEDTRLSRTLVRKQGSLVRVVGLRPVFTGTATVSTKAASPARAAADNTGATSSTGEGRSSTSSHE